MNELTDGIFQHQLQAERLFCAAALINPDNARHDCGWLDPKIFTSGNYAQFWRAVLDGKDQYAAAIEAGIYSDLLGANNDVASFYAANGFAQTIADDAYLINSAGVVNKLAGALMERNKNDVMLLVDELAKGKPDTGDSIPNVVDIALNLADMVEQERRAVKTHIVPLDMAMGGFERQTLNIVAARPSMGKCLARGTMVLMFDGSLLPVEHIYHGDLLMGPDSKPRKVLSIAHGKEMMYWVRQSHGIDYRVNESHILSLKRSKNEYNQHHGDLLNISVRDWLARGNYLHSRYKGYKVAVEFEEHELPIPPYLLGVWLGDGNTASSKITNEDQVVVDYMADYAMANGFELHPIKARGAKEWNICRNKRGGTEAEKANSLQGKLRELGVLNNKHIPNNYLINSKDNRLQLLAGLIDSDGHYFVDQNGPYEITMNNETMVRQIKFLCDSLGYRTSINSRIAQAQTGEPRTVWRVRFNGNVDEIPTRIVRKQAKPWSDFRDWTMTAIVVEPDKVDDYYGFELDGDGLFLLEDMTVTHNTALAFQIARNAAQSGHKTLYFSIEMSAETLWARAVCGALEVSWKDVLDKNTSKLPGGSLDTFRAEAVNLASKYGEDLLIDDSSRVTMDNIWQRVAKYSPDLLIVDHQGLVAHNEVNPVKRAGLVAWGLKQIGKEFEIPVIMLQQLNRGVEARDNKRPVMSDLRESGELEEIADSVIFIYREDYYLPPDDQPKVSETELIIAKHRNGSRNQAVKVMYHLPRQWFYRMGEHNG